MSKILEFMEQHIPSLAKLTDPTKRRAMLLWREEMRHHDFVLKNNRVVCPLCTHTGNCGQCGNSGHMARLQNQWKSLNQ